MGYAAHPLKIGLLLPFTGQYGWVGSAVESVVRMVVKEVHHTGGIDSHRIGLYQGDTEGVVDAGTLAAQKLVNADQVLALIGPTSLSFTGVKQIIMDNRIPTMSPTAGTTALDRGCQELCFRTVPSDSLGSYAIARAATDASKLKRDHPFTKVVLMVGQSPAMISFQEPLKNAFIKYHTPLQHIIRYIPKKNNYRSEVRSALSGDTDLIVLVGTPEDSVRIVINAYQLGYRGQWFFTQDQTNDDFLTLLPPQILHGAYGLEERASSENTERNRLFEAAYRKFSGKDVGVFAPNTYDAMTVLALAMLHAQIHTGMISRKTIQRSLTLVANPSPGDVVVTSFSEGKKALLQGKGIDYQGLVGPVDFDRYGNIRSPFGIRQVHNGQWIDLATLSAEELQ